MICSSRTPRIPTKRSGTRRNPRRHRFLFAQEQRTPDQLVFGYDGGHLLILLLGEFRMVVLHHQADEVDFVARAGRAFLKDYAMDLVVAEFAAH